MMNQDPRALPSQLGVRPVAQLSAGFLSQAFVWMFAGLLLTAAVAWLVQSNARLVEMAASLYLPVVIGQFILVIAISAAIGRLSALTALLLFFIYAATMGVTLSFIFLVYDLGTVSVAFVSAAAMFGGAALYGAVTKRSLSSIGGLLVMGLIGVVAVLGVGLWYWRPLRNEHPIDQVTQGEAALAQLVAAARLEHHVLAHVFLRDPDAALVAADGAAERVGHLECLPAAEPQGAGLHFDSHRRLLSGCVWHAYGASLCAGSQTVNAQAMHD